MVGDYRSVDEIAQPPPGHPVAAATSTSPTWPPCEAGFADVREMARYNGEPTVSLSIQKQSDANTVATASGIFKALDELQADVPPGAQLRVASDRSQFIRDSIRDILKNILIGIALTVGVLFLFLHSWRGTVIAAVAMPATIVATFLALDQMNFTINVMTLMGLGITVGILVTNTIVVLENIYRYLDQGADPREGGGRGHDGSGHCRGGLGADERGRSSPPSRSCRASLGSSSSPSDSRLSSLPSSRSSSPSPSPP